MSDTYKLLLLLGSIILYSCQEETTQEAATKAKPETKPVKIFSALEKDSAFSVAYVFEKQTNGHGSLTYKYTGDNGSHFWVIADTAHDHFDLVNSHADTTALAVEAAQVFTVNSQYYRVYKLVSDKDVTDGSASWFFNPAFGVLLKKSNTWRSAQVLEPAQQDSNYLSIPALLHRIYTTEGFYQNNAPPERKIKKFTPPKVDE